MATSAKSAAPEPVDPDRLQALLDALPAGCEPLDVVMLDGFLCGVLLQPDPVPEARWLAHVIDEQGRPVPAGTSTVRLVGLVRRRRAELADAIARRDWFDPWVYRLDDDASPSEAVMPWVAGFVLAMDLFAQLETRHGAVLLEPLAGLYRHLPPDAIDDQALADEIDTLEPPAELDEAVEDLVRGVLLIADVSLPVARAAGAGSGRAAGRSSRSSGAAGTRGGRRTSRG